MDYLNTIEYRISPVRALKITRNCSGCGRKTFFISTGQFRINANGSFIDIWLVYQCEKCRHTYNLAVYERTKAKKIPKQQYQSFLCNDESLALRCGTDLDLFKRNKAEADINGLEYRYEKIEPKALEAEAAKVSVGSALSVETDNGCVRIIIQNPYRLKVRIDKLLPELTKISRSQMKKLIQEEKICFAGTYLAERTEIILCFPFSPLPF